MRAVSLRSFVVVRLCLPRAVASLGRDRRPVRARPPLDAHTIGGADHATDTTPATPATRPIDTSPHYSARALRLGVILPALVRALAGESCRSRTFRSEPPPQRRRSRHRAEGAAGPAWRGRPAETRVQWPRVHSGLIARRPSSNFIRVRSRGRGDSEDAATTVPLNRATWATALSAEDWRREVDDARPLQHDLDGMSFDCESSSSRCVPGWNPALARIRASPRGRPEHQRQRAVDLGGNRGNHCATTRSLDFVPAV